MRDDKRIYIIELSFALNLITDASATYIARFIEYERSELKHLNLHWNKIKYNGGLRIAEALEKNTDLRILDLSWNQLG